MSYYLPRVVGLTVAADWMLTGRTVSAEEAFQRGLVSDLVADEDLLDPRRELASTDSRTLCARRPDRPNAPYRSTPTRRACSRRSSWRTAIR